MGMFTREIASAKRKLSYVVWSFGAGFVAGLIAASALGFIPGGTP
jgi:hypothetical protein